MTPPLCKEFAKLSKDTWDSIGDSAHYYRPHAVGIRETTITDGLLLRLYRHGMQHDDIRVFVPSEIRTGADFELVIVQGSIGTHFLLQAKRLNCQQRRYTGLAQKSKNSSVPGAYVYQVDTLCAAGGPYLPFFIFYNWYRQGNDAHESRVLFNEGCCLAPATRVRSLMCKNRKYVNALDLSTLSSLQWPWSRLVCPPNENTDLSAFALQQAAEMGDLRGASIDNARRPLSGAYSALWEGEADRAGELEGQFDRPVVIAGKRARRG